MPRKSTAQVTNSQTTGFTPAQTTRTRRGTRARARRTTGTGGGIITNGRSNMTSVDHPEGRAIGVCLAALKGLTAIAQQRVISYVGQSCNMNIAWPGFVGTETEQVLRQGATR